MKYGSGGVATGMLASAFSISLLFHCVLWTREPVPEAAAEVRPHLICLPLVYFGHLGQAT